MRTPAGPRRPWSPRVWSLRLALALGIGLATAVAVVMLGSEGSEPLPDFKPGQRRTVDAVATNATLSKVVYSSPQANETDPGTGAYWVTGHHCQPADPPRTGESLGKYTAWSGAWLMADGHTVEHAFMQTTGPTAPYPKVCSAAGVASSFDPVQSFKRATSTQIIRSTEDAGKRFKTVYSGKVLGTEPIPFTPQPTIALHANANKDIKENTLLRRVYGGDLQQVEAYDKGPNTAFLQTLAPGSKDWVDLPTEYGHGVILDPAKFTYQITRIRRLSDGRLIATGAVADVGSTEFEDYRWLLMVSDDEGATWRSALSVPPGAFVPNEWDVAEIPGGGGDLLAVMRTRDGGESIRAQARLVKGAEGTTTTTGTENDDGGWSMELPVKSPPQLPHSGHPELLAARVGNEKAPSVILHLATTGIHYTDDAGATWKPLRFPGGAEHHTGYYPRAVQTKGGTILVFSHRGADDPYRPDLNQAILMDRFRLADAAVLRRQAAARARTTTSTTASP